MSDHEAHPGYVLLEAHHIIELTDAVRALTRVMTRMDTRDTKHQAAVLDALKFIGKDVREMHDVLVPLPGETNGDAHKFELTKETRK